MAVPSTQTAAVVVSSKALASKVQIRSDHPVPDPGNGEILVKLEFSGVCHSDLHSIRGDTPMLTDVAGHEGVGKVIKGMFVILFMLATPNSCLLVGSGIDEKQWLGTRVGIRSVSG
jgi:propanol-preferring alcohol dehydrogenase